MNLAHEIILKF